MSFCEHCQGQRFDRAQVLRTLRSLRREWRSQGRRTRCEALDAAIRELRRLELPHLEGPDDHRSGRSTFARKPTNVRTFVEVRRTTNDTPAI
jgi:hypothetical protein